MGGDGRPATTRNPLCLRGARSMVDGCPMEDESMEKGAKVSDSWDHREDTVTALKTVDRKKWEKYLPYLQVSGQCFPWVNPARSRLIQDPGTQSL